MFFSKLTSHFEMPPNRLYAERDKLVAMGQPIVDLISGNVHKQGILFPAEVLDDAIREGLHRSAVYDPHPLGVLASRERVAAFYQSEGIMTIDAQRIALTPGTSISYWYAFRMLADIGDEILCPQPSYPLFEAIAQICGIQLISYPLRRKKRWELDLDSIERKINERTRAIVLISPHNPTGHVASLSEVQALQALARRKDLALIVDEVFSSFVMTNSPLPRPCVDETCFVLTLNGLSKMAALPGVKLGWMVVTGPSEKVRKAMRTLEHIADTFLPVNDAAQHALPMLLDHGRQFLDAYHQEIRSRMHFMHQLLRIEKSWDYTPPEGGFLFSLGLPPGIDEEAYCLRLLREHKLLIHPGYFYDFDKPHVVVSGISRREELTDYIPLFTETLNRL